MGKCARKVECVFLFFSVLIYHSEILLCFQKLDTSTEQSYLCLKYPQPVWEAYKTFVLDVTVSSQPCFKISAALWYPCWHFLELFLPNNETYPPICISFFFSPFMALLLWHFFSIYFFIPLYSSLTLQWLVKNPLVCINYWSTSTCDDRRSAHTTCACRHISCSAMNLQSIKKE